MQTVQTKLDKYAKKWKLSNPQPLASTKMGSLFKVEQNGQWVVLKILTASGVEDEADGAVALKIWAGNGAVKIFESEAEAVLTEYLPGPNLSSFSEIGNETQASVIFAEIIQKIHSQPVLSNLKLKDLAWRFKAFDELKLVSQNNIFLKGHEVSKELLLSQTQTKILHGDLHHYNVMQGISGEYLCFDPKGLLGDHCYELGPILLNPWHTPEISENELTCLSRAQHLSEILNYPYDRVIKFAFVHACLSALWNLQDGLDISHPLKVASFLERHI